MKKLSIGIIAVLSVVGVCQAQTPAAGQAPNSEHMPPSGTMGTGQMSKGQMGYGHRDSSVNGTVKKQVTLRIKESNTLREQQRKMGKGNIITLGEKTFRLPAGIEEITVVHDMSPMKRNGRPVTVRVAFNHSDCKIQVMGHPMESNRKVITIYVGEQTTAGGRVSGYCEKATISG